VANTGSVVKTSVLTDRFPAIAHENKGVRLNTALMTSPNQALQTRSHTRPRLQLALAFSLAPEVSVGPVDRRLLLQVGVFADQSRLWAKAHLCVACLSWFSPVYVLAFLPRSNAIISSVWENAMTDFWTSIEEIYTALETSDFHAPEEFSDLTVQIAERTALAMVQELRAYKGAGGSDLEAVATFPFVLAFLVNVFTYCTELRGSAAAVERIVETATKVAHALGDGDAERLIPRRKPSLNHH
jgi:hypothetical protein